MVAVKAASFYRLANGTLIVVCEGSFAHRALPLMITIGSVVAQGVNISPDGQLCTGVLPRTPNPGDEVVARYLPEPPTRTGLRFPSAATIPVA